MQEIYFNNTGEMKADKYVSQFMNNWDHFFDALTDMITIHDDDFNIIYANSAALKALKIPSKHTKRIKCYKYYHGSNQPPKNCPSCRALKSREPALVEIFEPHLNKNVEIRAFPRTNGINKTVGSIHIVRDISERKKSEQQLRDSREKLRNLTAHLQYVRELERSRIAREIHDELGQELAVLNLEILRLGKKVPRKQKSFHNKIESISKRIDVTISTVQKIVAELRPALIDKLDLQAAIEWQVEEFQKLTGIKCNLVFDAELIKLDKEYEIYIYRIFQEILTNIMRHSSATKVIISFIESSGQLVIEIKDNGKGINEEQLSSPKSFGIIGINERVSFMGGLLTIRGIPNKGTSITVNIPLHQTK